MDEDLPRSGDDARRYVDDILAPWRRDLIVSRCGDPKPLLANAITAFRNAPEWAGILRFDAFHQRTVLRGKAPWMDSPADEEWTGTHDAFAADWLQRHGGIMVSPDVAGQAVEVVSRERRFHPVLDYLHRCRWDGEFRLDDWAVKYLGAEDTPYVRAVSGRWMISAVARVSEPGCKADSALILEGKQGLLKSTALATLANPWFTDELADVGSKDAAMQLLGVWIVELAELDSLSRSDAAKSKAFMSRTTDRFRPPYGRRVESFRRQCVFAGTVNHNDYLRDETGGRRFWPIACTKIDIDGLAAERDQLWAEARDRYLAGEKWWLDTVELTASATQEQRGRYRPDPWHEHLAKFVNGRQSVSVIEVLKDLCIPIEKQTQLDANRVVACLKALGWERKQKRVEGKPQWRYWPPVSPV